MTLLAYACTEEDEGTGGIYFGATNIEARKAFADEHHGGELGGLTVYRAPWADRWAGKPVPAWLMIANAWHFECSGCGERIDEDFLAERRRPLASVIGSQWAAVYCCPRCYRRETRRRARAKAREADAIEQLKQRVRKRFGDVEFTHTHAYCPERGERGRWWVQQASVCFIYPGMKWGPASLRYDTPNSWDKLVGPPALHYQVPTGDVATFEAWAAATKVAA